MTVYVFTGPTLSPIEGKKLLDAVFLPPVAQGDVAGLIRQKPRAVGIIDGYFECTPSVWHKEILAALDAGIYVAGAASMGALRAAELEAFGMVGVGEIFRWYRDGVIDADDEVAVRHGADEDQFRPISTAMVNLRKTLAEASRYGVITSETHQFLLRRAKETHYSERSWRLLTQPDACYEEHQRATMTSWLVDNRVDLKRLDAEALLRHLAGDPLLVLPTTHRFQQTSKYQLLLEQDQALLYSPEVRITPEVFLDYLRLAYPRFSHLRRRAGRNSALLALARKRGERVYDQDRQPLFKAIEQRFGMPIDRWRTEQCMTVAELHRFCDEQVILRRFNELRPRIAPNPRPGFVDLLRQMRMDGVFQSLLMGVIDLEKACRHVPPQSFGGRGGAQVFAAFLKLRQWPPDTDLETLVAKLGFQSQVACLHQMARHLYVAELNPG